MRIVGRDSELRAVDAVLAGARVARAGVLAVRGEPGIGKSTLLAYAEEAAAGFSVLRVCGWEAEQQLAFAGLEQVLRPLLDGLSQLPAVQQDALRGALAIGAGAGGDDRFAVCAAALGLLTRRAEQGPVLVVIDDLQWLDAPSRECLLFVARRLDADRVAMTFAERCLSAAESMLAREPRIGCVDLGPLGDDNARALIGAVHAGELADEQFSQILETSGGNPLAVVEMARAVASGAACQEMVGSMLFAPYLTGLDEPDRQVLLIVALSGPRDLGPALAAIQAQGLPVRALDDLVDRGLLTRSSRGVQFRHPLLRSAATAIAGSGQRRAAHLALADALADPAQADRRAWHLASAAVGPDEQAAAALEASALRYRDRLAYASCAAAMERAGELSPASHGRALRMLEAARAWRLAGDPQAAQRTAESAAAAAQDPITCAHAEAIAGWLALSMGTPEQAAAKLRRAGELFEGQDPQRAADAYAGAASAVRVSGDLFGAASLASRALALAGAESGGSAVLALITLGVAGMTGGDVHGAVRHMLDAIRELARSRAAPDEVLIAVYAGRAAWPFDLPGLRGVLTELVAELRARGALGSLPAALYGLSYLDLRAGHLRRARDRAEEAASLARSTGDLFIQRCATACLALVAAHLGDEPGCRSRAAEAIAMSEERGARPPAETFDALGLLELQLGNSAQAVRHLDRDNRASPAESLDMSRWCLLDLAEAHFRSGAQLPTYLADHLDAAGGVNHPALASVVWRVRGLLADAASYPEIFDRALQMHEQSPMPIEQARTRLCYGERLRRDGHRVRAREQLTAALATFEHAGAQLLAQRARAELAATGAPVTRPAPSAAELTAQESRVADAVARGLSNRDAAAALFLSHKTIEMHLGNAYRKLGVRSRTQLVHHLGNLRARSAAE